MKQFLRLTWNRKFDKIYIKNKPKKFFAIEKDKDLALSLKNNFKDKIVIINKDILDVNEKKYQKKVIVFETAIIFLQKFYVNGF